MPNPLLNRRLGNSLSPWWLLNGIISPDYVVDAWDFANSDSFSSSLTGKQWGYTLTPGTKFPAWSAGTGIFFNDSVDSAQQILQNTSLSWSRGHSVLVRGRIVDLGGSGSGRYVVFNWDGSTDNTTLVPGFSGDTHWFKCCGTTSGGTKKPSLVSLSTYGISNLTGYYNGTSDESVPFTGVTGTGFYVGNRPNFSRCLHGYIYQIAWFSTTLSSTQMGALHSTMMTL